MKTRHHLITTSLALIGLAGLMYSIICQRTSVECLLLGGIGIAIVLLFVAAGKANRTLRERLEFSRVISSVSNHFVGTAGVDEAIDVSLAELGRYASADRSYIFLLQQNGALMDNTHEWCADGVSPQRENLLNLPCSAFPWWISKLRKNERIHIRNVSQLPPEAEQERRILESQEIKSLIVVPLNINGELAGFLGFDNVQSAGAWRERQHDLLILAAQAISRAIAHQRADTALQHSVDLLRKLNRAYSLLSECNRRLSRVPGEAAALQQACQALTDVGGYRAGWIGYANCDDPKTVSPAASSGIDLETLVKARITWSDTAPGHGAAVDDIQTSPKKTAGNVPIGSAVCSWPELAAQQGMAGAVSLPLRLGKEVIGTLNLGTEQTGVFEQQEISLLKELAEDLVYVIRYWRERQAAEETEQQLHHTEERNRALVEKSMECSMIVTPQGQINYVSPAISSILDYAPEEFARKDIFHYLHPDEKKSMADAYTSLLNRGGGSKELILRVLHSDGTWRTVNSIATNLIDNQAIRGVVINFHDITERRILGEQLQEAQKMEIMGQLAGGVAHDFNNSLMVITSLSDMLLESANADSDEYKDLLDIKRASELAAQITRQLLAFSHRQVFHTELLDMNVLVQDQQKMLERLIGEDISVKTQLAAGLWSVTADAGQLQQVIMNLAVNARDAMPDGGRILISTRNVRFSAEDVAAFNIEAGQYVCLCVADTGTGIAPEAKAHLFEPFFTTKAVGTGTGLGLLVVHGIIVQHNGRIVVYSEPGEGAVFRIYLPAATEESAPDQAVDINESVPGAAGQRILLVEDDLLVRSVISRNLRRRGYEVFEASGSATAQSLFENEGGRFHVLVSDVVLPDGNGVKLARRLAAKNPRMRVIMTSGYADERARWPEIEKQEWRFLQKPYPQGELSHVLQDVLDENA